MFEVTNRPNEPVILLISMCNYIFMVHLLVTIYNQLEPGQGKSVMSQNLVYRILEFLSQLQQIY